MIAVLVLALASVDAGPSEEPPVRSVKFLYDIRIVQNERVAEVRLRVKQDAPALRQLRFHIDPDRHLSFSGDGDLLRTEDDDGEVYLAWQVPGGGGELTWTSRIEHLRDPRSYDARMTTSWALFRGSDVVPPAASSFSAGSQSTGRVRFDLPKKWKLVTQHRERESGGYSLEDDRFFLRPAGWFMTGRIRTLNFKERDLEVTLATTRRLGADLVDVRTFLRFTLPHLLEVLGRTPDRLVVVSGPDPMWRGGLSGPKSLYLHKDRPLVSPDGTSPILHELVHVLSEAKAGQDGDWVVEGLAELYALQVLRRAGGLSQAEFDESLSYFKKKGRRVTSIRTNKATGAITARSVTTLWRLHLELEKTVEGGLDPVVRELAATGGPVTTQSFMDLVVRLGGSQMEAWFEENVP